VAPLEEKREGRHFLNARHSTPRIIHIAERSKTLARASAANLGTGWKVIPSRGDVLHPLSQRQVGRVVGTDDDEGEEADIHHLQRLLDASRDGTVGGGGSGLPEGGCRTR
jgi:hypothetical protein